MLELCRNLARQKRLLKQLVARDLKARYVGSSMGFFWSVIYPIINLAIYSFVFRVVLKMRWDDKMPVEEAVLLMFAGILVWAAFAESLSRSTISLVENANLIQKVVFPSEVLSPYLSLSSIVNMTIGLPIVLAAVAWFGYIAPARAPAVGAASGGGTAVEVAELEQPAASSAEGQEGAQPRNPTVAFSEHEHQDVAPRTIAFGPGLLALPLLVALQILFTVGLGYFLSAFNLLLRDTYHVMGVLITVWMFATPIFYPANLVSIAGYGWVLALNPMHWLISSYRDVLLYGQWPELAVLLRFAAVAALAFFLGAAFFQRQKDRFPDLL